MRKRLMLIIILCAGSLLAACSKNKDDDLKNSVNIYYIDVKTSGLVSEKYELISTEATNQIDELLYNIKLNPENLVYKSVLPEDVPKPAFTLNEDGGLTLNFDTAYNKITGIPEILCRAALVKTLSQINEVEYVQISVNGNPLRDTNGDVVKSMTAEDFIDNTQTNTNYKVKLYFANRKGNALLEYDTVINYSGNGSIEELAIEQLINGPTELGYYRTIPEGTVLLNVTKSDGICTVDFNEKFLVKMSEVQEEVAIYSIVNTLVELPDIKRVQFTINNQVVTAFWDDEKFDVIFERKLDLIEAVK